MKEQKLYDIKEVADFRELLLHCEEEHAENTAFLWRSPDKENGIATRTYADLVNEARALSSYLSARGYKGKNIAVTGKNSYEWVLSYFTAAIVGNFVVPLDRELRADEIAALVKDAECAAVLYTADMEEKLAELDLGADKLPLARLDDMLVEGYALREGGDTAFEDAEIDSDAVSVLLYTSGTMGVAKGVMLTQGNICYDACAALRRVRVYKTDRMLSHLPLHHTYECLTEVAMLHAGGSIAYNESMRRLPADFSLFKPSVLVTVPAVLTFMSRFISKGYSEARGGKILLAVQKAASATASTIGLFSRDAALKQKRNIFSTVSNFLGGNLRLLLVGAAGLSPALFRTFEECGFAVYCGYGLTETAPIAIMHTDTYHKPGDIGMPVYGVEARIDEPDENGIGEICIRGPIVMKGYYRNEEATAEALRDGWFHTGDLGKVAKNGAFIITGRKKSMIVANNGKKIFPEELEAYLEKDEIVGEAFVYAEDKNGKQIIVAAVYPNETAVAKAVGLEPTDEGFGEAQKQLFSSLISRINASFPVYKHISKLIIRKTPFEKTTTQKIRRNAEGNKNETDAEI